MDIVSPVKRFEFIEAKLHSGLSTVGIAELTARSPTTIKRMEQGKTRIDVAVFRLLEATGGKILVPGWDRWEFDNGYLFPPGWNNHGFTPGQILSLQYTGARIRAMRQEIERLKENNRTIKISGICQ